MSVSDSDEEGGNWAGRHQVYEVHWLGRVGIIEDCSVLQTPSFTMMLLVSLDYFTNGKKYLWNISVEVSSQKYIVVDICK